MSLDANLNNEIKNAMLQKEEAKLRTLRAIKSAFLLAKTEKGGNGQISEEQELKVLQKLFNQRKESFEIFTKENRAELAAKEKEEMDIIGAYLPAQLSDEELKSTIQQIIQTLGVTSIKEMGKVMGAASKQLQGKAEGGRISSVVKELLE
ncbi:MAG TPA: GatB/YqeY domain-containing protein [Chitinophagales bacterium]|nr:GatB/YqeY domain-containing protein [Chitinophagales bacterium]MCB9074921.1 GatB/YqeY domain-containing protein [Chitinophagales bacterium]HMU98144.1 GatB/YqeY domain-containing protein [Chitinophagales bacterium]HMV02691.1 GatB/YqeY domain-containing protein [Chitinophagales bacterium]HMW94715.1 GatB/YqeY domain-containing protein [Chitinophagales bacterium]